MCVVKGVCHAGMQFDAIELKQRREVPWKTNVETADRPEFVFVRPVYDACVRCDRETGPVFEVFACREVKGCSTRCPDPV